MDTKARILDKALEMFNEKGIEYVGMREIATALDMRIGNLTYYFPTKDELVHCLSEKYSTANSTIHKSYPVASLLDFLNKQSAIFDNMIIHRSLMLSMVHLMDQNALIAAYYGKVRGQRKVALEENMQALTEAKYLKIASIDEEWTLVSINSLLGRFWMSEAVVSGKKLQLQKQKTSYLKLLALFFRPYSTAKGLKDINEFLSRLE